MATLPKELRQKKAKIHKTNPSGHAGEGGPQSQPNDGMSEARQEKEDLGMEKKSMGEGFPKHPQVKSEAVHQKKLINDTAYFLHHPQIPPHGPKMPPAKPRG